MKIKDNNQKIILRFYLKNNFNKIKIKLSSSKINTNKKLINFKILKINKMNPKYILKFLKKGLFKF